MVEIALIIIVFLFTMVILGSSHKTICDKVEELRRDVAVHNEDLWHDYREYGELLDRVNTLEHQLERWKETARVESGRYYEKCEQVARLKKKLKAKNKEIYENRRKSKRVVS